jgi:hypothetical protein
MLFLTNKLYSGVDTAKDQDVGTRLSMISVTEMAVVLHTFRFRVWL